MVLLLLAIVFFIGLVGGSAFLLVRQALDRLSGHAGDNFESRVLDELEVLRLRLDRISERLDAPAEPRIGPVDPPLGRLPGDSESRDSSA
jgi:hypothetical protein